MAHEGTTSAARGRIIKKGSGSPASPVTSRSDGRRGRRAKDRRLVTPKMAPRTRDLVTTFIILPAIFAASAAFMWSRPVERVDNATENSSVSLDSRFHSIGHELAGRFSAPSSGVVIPHRKGERVHETRATGVAAVRSTGVSDPVKAPSQIQTEALEKQVHRILKRHGKPTQNGKDLAAAIVKEALLQDYDPVFVAAVIKSESAFNALAKSHKGAQGLMQIMPRTGAWLADQAAIPRGKLTDPGHNLKLGISYLKQLEAGYKGNRMLTLVAYNWGPGHVESASAGSRRVPGEVMQYAIKILNDYRRWSSELRSTVG